MARMSLGGITLDCCIVDARIGVPVAAGSCDVVLGDDADDRPMPIPASIRAAVEQFEGKSLAG